MNYKRAVLLVVLVLAVASLFFFSSWTNAMVVGEEEISYSAGTLSKISPLAAGLLIVITVGILVAIAFD